MTGRLSLVGTPIGNLGDITYRAVECLRESTRIFAEDTRRTKALLTHLGIEGKKVIALHAHSRDGDLETAVRILLQGELVALVTDAGMPTVSDPGRALVELCRQHDVPITVVPGPSAVTAAVALSGLVEGGFCFLGFLPRKGEKRRRALVGITESPVPTVLFESPHRITETLEDLAKVAEGERRVVVCREITKKFEETLTGSLAELVDLGRGREWLGELTVVIDKSHDDTASEFDVEERARELVALGGGPKEIATQIVLEASKSGAKPSRREVYQLVLGLIPKE